MIDVILSFIKENSVEVLAIWGSIITVASLVVKLTPSKADDGVWAVVMKILNALALNPNKDKVKKEVEAELRERDDSRTVSSLTDSLR